MKNKLIIRISNNLGNQMFMYASAYAFSKKIERELLIDNETSYMIKNNIYKYNLDIFNIQSKVAPSNFKFLGNIGYLKRKFIKLLDKLNSKKSFYIETKDSNKYTSFTKYPINNIFKDPLYVEGHFESEKYFIDCVLEIKSEFKFKNEKSFTNTQIFKDIKNSNSVSICIRQNRFSERKRLITKDDERNSLTFTKDQIRYIKKSIDLIKSKVPNPKFFLWSNDHKNLKNYFSGYEYTSVSTGKIDLDLFLMTQSKHFIVIPSSYNWWGAWLRNNKDSIILRPSDQHFSNFRLNNKDFWPDSWTKV